MAGGSYYGYKIRGLQTQEDVKAIGLIRSQAWREAYEGIVSEEALDIRTPEYCAKRAEKLLTSEAQTFLAMDTGGRIVGFIICGACRDEDKKNAGEICALYTLRETYGKGVGHDLMKAAQSHLDSLGYECETILWVLEHNSRARAFYAKEGFSADGASKQLPDLGEGVIEIRMARQNF